MGWYNLHLDSPQQNGSLSLSRYCVDIILLTVIVPKKI